MGEFDDLDPAKLSESVDQERSRMKREAAETTRRQREEADRRTAERHATLIEAEDRTADLFSFLQRAFHGRKMSINHTLVVERTGSRPEGVGLVRMDEKPAWVVIRADGWSTSARQRPSIAFTPEYVLAARCGVQTKYEMLVYPTLEQDRIAPYNTDDRDEFIKRIQDEVAGR